MLFCVLALSLLLASVAVAEERQTLAVDGDLHCLTPQTPAELRELLRYEAGKSPLISAHRGGAGIGKPENCLETFEATLRETPSMLEVDPRMTADGQIVLHHDATLERTTTGAGKVSDYTLAELKALRLKDRDGKVTDFVMPTLDEAIEWARGKTILVLDQKDVPLETRVAKIGEHDAEAFVMLIVSSFDDVQRVHRLNPEIAMEVMLVEPRRVDTFDEIDVPWDRVVGFVGHKPPQPGLCDLVHERGQRCMAGTSRYLDGQLRTGGPEAAVAERYRELLKEGVDIIETDLPIEVSRVIGNVEK